MQQGRRRSKSEPEPGPPPKRRAVPVGKRAAGKAAAGLVVGSVADAVARDLAAISGRAPDVARSALAATAEALAKELDDPENSATSKSMCAGQLRDTLDRLRELVPPVEEGDDLDDLSARRARRLAGRKPGASAQLGS